MGEKSAPVSVGKKYVYNSVGIETVYASVGSGDDKTIGTRYAAQNQARTERCNDRIDIPLTTERDWMITFARLQCTVTEKPDFEKRWLGETGSLTSQTGTAIRQIQRTSWLHLRTDLAMISPV